MQRMRAELRQPASALEPHNMLATAIADESGVAPDLRARPELAEPLVFGPLLPPRYRLDGPGAQPGAEQLFLAQLSASPRAPVGADDINALRDLGLADLADLLGRTAASAEPGAISAAAAPASA
jgi:hypothetical protein